MNSIINNVCSFNSKELIELGLKASILAVPGVMVVGSARMFSIEFHPQFTVGNISEPDSRSFIITTYNESQLEKVITRFMQELPETLRTTDLKDRYVQDLMDFQGMVRESAQALKCKKIDVGFSFSGRGELFPMQPYMAIAGRAFAVYSNPFMNFHLDPDGENENLQKGVQPFSDDEKRFICAHEVSHIVSEHNLVQSIMSFAYGVFNTFLWQQCWSEDYSVCNTFGIALVAAFIYQLFFFAVVRDQEQQADLSACDALESNEGALKFFATIIELRKGEKDSVDVGHPPISRRIEYVNAWQEKRG